ncbi:MAG: SRPBCC family protein [Mycobacteriales bacterium]|nr:MAG: dimethyladenosine transferase [Pseudonocardiales bacterium]
MSENRQVSESVVVNAPAQRIFDVLADPRRHHEVDGSGSVQQSVSGPQRLELGSTFGMSMRLGISYRVTNRVVEFEDGKLIAWRHFAGHRWRYELEPVDDASTRVTETFDYSTISGGRARILELLGFPERNRRGITQTLDQLARLCGSSPRGRPHG